MDQRRRPDSAFPGPRRVFTAPTYSGPSAEQTSTSKDGAVETLYSHPSVKVVSFSAGPRPVFGHGKGIAPPPEIEPGSLPWSSQLERTIAAGQFRIYRAPGSVAFLSCGSALQPILPKSQCWCVDELSSKYVLQIRRPQYWRIEVPAGSQDEIRRALELRDVLGQVLQFEKTECPFIRGFTVELPERPQTPVKKRPWTPISRRSSTTVLPPTPVTPDIAPIHGTRGDLPASPLATPRRNILDDVSSTDVIAEAATSLTPGASERRQEGDPAAAGTVEGAVTALEQVVQVRKDVDAVNNHLKLAAPGGFQANRSVTAPPQLTLVTVPSSGSSPTEAAAELPTVPEAIPERPRSPTDSSDGSFHSVKSWTSVADPLPPSPPLTATGSPKLVHYPQQYLYVPKKAHQHESAELTVTPNTPRTLTGDSSDGTESHQDEPSTRDTSVHEDESSSTCSVHTADDSPQSPIPTSHTEQSSAAAATNPTLASVTAARTTSSSTTSTILTRRPHMRHRPTASSSISPSRGALPRLPSAADLFPSYSRTSHSSQLAQQSRLSLVRNLPKAIIHKTIEILLSPPSHLIDLMLKVAARISAGEWRGYVFGFGEAGETIPVRWDWSDGDDDGEGELGGWGADEDWAFAQRASKSSPPKMAGAFPESPEEERVVQLGPTCEGGEGGMPESPTLLRKARKSSQAEDVSALSDLDKEDDDDDEEKDSDAGSNAGWTGSLSID
ncbi:inheritance of peroxisomes protein 1-domain-containing protein [Coniochaeta sp. 2T2.1]|nr:inheritance of peroxisomes protein 1-domain-containing protein [Coniochaeta sp. 2T2.1]